MTHWTKILSQPFRKTSESSNYPKATLREGRDLQLAFKIVITEEQSRTVECKREKTTWIHSVCCCSSGTKYMQLWFMKKGKYCNEIWYFCFFYILLLVYAFDDSSFVRFQLSSKWGWRFLSRTPFDDWNHWNHVI